MRWPAWRLFQGSCEKVWAADKGLMPPNIMPLSFGTVEIHVCRQTVSESAMLSVQVKAGACAGQPRDSLRAAT